MCCDRLKEEIEVESAGHQDGYERVQNPRYSEAMDTLQKSGCFTQNEALALCMEQNDRNWRECKQQTADLKHCFQQIQQHK